MPVFSFLKSPDMRITGCSITIEVFRVRVSQHPFLEVKLLTNQNKKWMKAHTA